MKKPKTDKSINLTAILEESTYGETINLPEPDYFYSVIHPISLGDNKDSIIVDYYKKNKLKEKNK